MFNSLCHKSVLQGTILNFITIFHLHFTVPESHISLSKHTLIHTLTQRQIDVVLWKTAHTNTIKHAMQARCEVKHTWLTHSVYVDIDTHTPCWCCHAEVYHFPPYTHHYPLVIISRHQRQRERSHNYTHCIHTSDAHTLHWAMHQPRGVVFIKEKYHWTSAVLWNFYEKAKLSFDCTMNEKYFGECTSSADSGFKVIWCYDSAV